MIDLICFLTSRYETIELERRKKNDQEKTCGRANCDEASENHRVAVTARRIAVNCKEEVTTEQKLCEDSQGSSSGH